MIISKTPLRISFFGGGTDYPAWFSENKGMVIGTTIDKFTYISCRFLPPFFKHKHRIIYSQIENVFSINDIKHPSIRECLKYKSIKRGIEIHHDADLPARSGLGSSSSFTTGLLNCLNKLENKSLTKKKLAKNTIHVEQNLIKENVGSQDQIHAAYGGFNKINFFADGNFRVNSIKNESLLKNLESSCLLFFTGFSRFASDIASDIIKNTPKRKMELQEISSIVAEAAILLKAKKFDINNFGKLMDESWQLKKTLSSTISNKLINEIYSEAISSGALGGKLLGAGGGGFILFIADKKHHKRIIKRLKNFLHVPFRFEKTGSQIIFNDKT